MFKKLRNKFINLSVDSVMGRFFSDKSYKYDVIFFMTQFIKNNSIDGFFNYAHLKLISERYTVEKFTLNPDADGNGNFMAETLNLLEYAHIIRNNNYGVYEILEKDILDFISQSFENAYIFQYMIAYYTFVNDEIIESYSNYVNETLYPRKENILREIYDRLCEISPSIGEIGTEWSHLYTKYPIMVLGLANEDKSVSRTLKVKKNKNIDAFSLSANVDGTKTRAEFKKTNTYSKNFDLQYVKDFLNTILVRRG